MIIKSLLDTDLYKFSMGQVFFEKYLTHSAEYLFVCRNKDVKLGFLKNKVLQEIDHLCQLQLTHEEIDFLKSLNLFSNGYLNYLKDFKLKKEHVKVSVVNEQLNIRISGPMVEVSPWEIYLLSTINELYFEHLSSNHDFSIGRAKLQDKISLIQKQPSDFKFMEFGTRRRFSQSWQEEVLATLNQQVPKHLIGTSNVYLAKKLQVKPVGTLAHEYLQCHQVLAPDLKTFQKTALKVWQEVYQDKLLVALTDVISTDSFLADLDEKLSSSFTGLRHDSGDPLVFGHKVLNHYKKFNIDPKSKTLVFSDGLDFPKAINIFNTFNSQTNMIFGIGTNLTNDVGIKALNIVIKMVSCDFQPVAKISDEPSKAICEDPVFLEKLKNLFGIKS